MRIVAKKLDKNNYEIFVKTKGKFLARLGNLLIDDSLNEYMRLDFNKVRHYIAGGAVLTGILKKKLINLNYII